MERQYEYRIKYRHADDQLTNYHYYLATDVNQALGFQMEAIRQHDWDIQILSIERKCPWSDKWLQEDAEQTQHTINTKSNE